MYYLLTETFKEQQTQLVKLILDALPAQHIYLLGSTLQQRRTETIFMPTAPSCRSVGHYYVLVLVNEDGNPGIWQDKLENICRQFIPLTALVIKTETFMDWLQAGHAFAHTVQQRAVLLHGDAILFDAPQTTDTANTATGSAAAAENAALQKVRSFLAGAELYMIRKEHKMAAFMLHQCAEHALLALLKKGSSLHVNTHSLDKLLRYCSMVNYRIQEIFPRHTEQQERLFQLLQKAYIDTRYKDDYHINTADLEAIKAILVKLVDIVQYQGNH